MILDEIGKGVMKPVVLTWIAVALVWSAKYRSQGGGVEI